MTQDSTLQEAAPRLQDTLQHAPTYKQKVGAYMRVDTDASTSSVRQNSSYNYGAVLDATFLEDNEASPCKPPDSSHGATASNRVPHFDHSRIHKRNMRLSLFHLLMSRCQALQSILNALERKPLTQELTLDIHANYSRILGFAQESKTIAEGLESDALRARSEYWAGRSYGGLRDWQAATIHFTNAIRLDASHIQYKRMRSHYTGLLPHEKEDVQFLLQNATQRYNEWTLRSKKIQESQHGHGIEDTNWEDLKGSVWKPNWDFRNWVVKQQLEKHKKYSTRTNVFLPGDGQRIRKLWKHEIPMIRKRLAMLDDNAFLRRTLNADEWFYVLRGISTTGNDYASPNNKSKVERGDSRDGKVITTPPAISPLANSFEQSHFKESRNLDDELQQLGYSSGEETRPASASSFEPLTCSDDEDYLQLLPAPTSPDNSTNQQTTPLRIHSSQQEVGWGSPVLTPISQTGSITNPD